MRSATVMGATQLAAAADGASTTGLLNERFLLSRILHPVSGQTLQAQSVLEAIAKRDGRRPRGPNVPPTEISASKKSASEISASKISVPPKLFTDFIGTEVQRPPFAVLAFLKEVSARSGPLYEQGARMDSCALALIRAASAKNLSTVIEFLLRYWQSSGTPFQARPSAVVQQAHAVLQRALQMAGDADLPSQEVFLHFLNQFETELKLRKESIAVIRDMMVRLSVEAWGVKAGDDLKLRWPDLVLSDETAALMYAKREVKPSIRVLLTEQAGPASVSAILQELERPEQVLELLEHLELSSRCLEVYAQSQSAIALKLLELGGERLLFPVLQRMQPVTSKTLNVCTEFAKRPYSRLNQHSCRRLLELFGSGAAA